MKSLILGSFSSYKGFMCNQTALYWFSTYWFRASYPFRPLIHSALIDSDVAKQPLRIWFCKSTKS
ncbi:hypothetical protein Hanom_Chr15g01357421 [Helianthus anomalus]